MSENDMRARLERTLRAVPPSAAGITAYADAILRECEVKFREPEVDPRDVEAAKAMDARCDEATNPDELGWRGNDHFWSKWLIAEARRERLALDAAEAAGVREMRDAVVSGDSVSMWTFRGDVHALAARLLRAKNGG